VNRNTWPKLGWFLALTALGCGACVDGLHEPAEDRTEQRDKLGPQTSDRVMAPAPGPIVAALFTEGKELVIQPLPEKLKAQGVSLDELRKLRHRRFSAGEWVTEVGGKKIDLSTVARLSVRKLHAPPFTVALPDGRKVVVTPRPDRIGAYLVTGEFFEGCVRSALAEPNIDPARVHVLEGIRVPGGQVPNTWGPGHVHISVGEPLSRFARVTIQEPNAGAAKGKRRGEG
jgi:hypothetical protein